MPDGGTKVYDDKDDVIDALQTGILSRKLVRYAYKDSRGRKQRGHLAPFAMLLYRHGLYVVGCRVRDPSAAKELGDWRKALGVFAVERFTDADHVRDRSFDVPADFTVSNVLHGAFGIHVGDPAEERRVVIEFTRDKAALVSARRWHPTQVIEDAADGGVVLAFTVTNLIPVVSWILEWGPHAPPSLTRPAPVTSSASRCERAGMTAIATWAMVRNPAPSNRGAPQKMRGGVLVPRAPWQQRGVQLDRTS